MGLMITKQLFSCGQCMPDQCQVGFRAGNGPREKDQQLPENKITVLCGGASEAVLDV